MRIALLIPALILAGCNEPPPLAVDQCARHELFKQCMAALPAGPSSTQYNDWAEVVDECKTHAYYTALRQPEFIAPACRAPR